MVFRNKKAQDITDILLFSVILLVMGIGFFTLHFTYSSISTLMLNSTSINMSSGAVAALENSQATSNKLDYVFFVIMISFMIAIIIMGYFTSYHSAFMVVYIILMVIGGLLSAILSYVWSQFVNVAAFASTLTHFPITNFIMQHLLVFYCITAVLAFVATFAKTGETS